MDLGLSGRTAIVTGASRGIGLAVTRGLVAEGVHVTAGARQSSAELAELAGTHKVRAAGRGGRPGRTGRACQAGRRGGDRIDILVSNVGSAPARPGGFGAISEDWQDSLALNLMAAVRTIRAALPFMLAGPHGIRVNTISHGPVRGSQLTEAEPPEARTRWSASRKHHQTGQVHD